MAKCNRCKMEMCDSSTKTCATYEFVEFPDGTKMSPVPYNPPDPTDRCHDCNIEAGGFHHVGCDMEICPRCGSQFTGCSCRVAQEEVKCINTQCVLSKEKLKELHTFLRIIQPHYNDFCIVNGKFRSISNNKACIVHTFFDYFLGMNFIIHDIKMLVKMISVLDKKNEIIVNVDNMYVSFSDGLQTVNFDNYASYICDNKFISDDEIKKMFLDNIDDNRPLVKEILPKSVICNISKVTRFTYPYLVIFKHIENNLNEGNLFVGYQNGSKNNITQTYAIRLKEKLLTPMDKDHYLNIPSLPFVFTKSNMTLAYNFSKDQNILTLIHKTKVNGLSINIYARSAYHKLDEE